MLGKSPSLRRNLRQARQELEEAIMAPSAEPLLRLMREDYENATELPKELPRRAPTARSSLSV